MENAHHERRGAVPSGNRGPRLPYELLSMITRSLADDRALRTAAHLNETSKTVREETLSALFETLDLEDEEAFAKAIGGRGMKGWKHCKYLFLSEATSLLLQEHLRSTRSNADDNTPDLAVTFPKLVFVRTLKKLEKGYRGERAMPASIELHRPIPLDVLLDHCSRKTRYKDRLKDVRVSLFGIHLAEKKRGRQDRFQERSRDDPLDVNINSLCIMRDGGLLPFPEGVRKVLKKQGHLTELPGPQEFSLTFQEDRSDKATSTTISSILEHAKLVKTEGIKTRYMEPNIYFKLSGGPLILKAFNKILRTLQPLVLKDLFVTLKGPDLNKDDVKRALEALADAYSPKWKHNQELHYNPFVDISYETSVIPEQYRARTIDVPDVTGMIHGQLIGGQSGRGGTAGRGVSEEWYGFRADVQEGYRVGGQCQDGTVVFERDYPCAHAPDPMWD